MQKVLFSKAQTAEHFLEYNCAVEGDFGICGSHRISSLEN